MRSSLQSPLKRSKRAKRLDLEGMIPLPEGSEKNPDVGRMIDSRSRKSTKLRKSGEIKGFVLEKDKSVRSWKGSMGLLLQ